MRIVFVLSLVTGLIGSVINWMRRRRLSERATHEGDSAAGDDRPIEPPGRLGYVVLTAVLNWLPLAVFIVIAVSGIDDPLRRWGIAITLILIASSVGAMWFVEIRHRRDSR
jgi:ABC-type Fe3+ transport system permease subunit